MRSLFAGLTARGRSFLAAGAAIGALGFALGQRALLSVGVLLVLLPVLAGLAAGRTRYRIRCARELVPSRVPAGEPAEVKVRLENISRLPTGLLLAEDTVPYSLGTRPRFVLDRIEQGGARQLSYQVQAGSRGRYPIGPFRVRIADVFGLVEVGHTYAAQSTLVVTPAITALPSTVPPGSWLGEGQATAATAATAGEDDIVPRAYREGDELRRVHWRSTARHGELMVRREEQHWRNRAVIFLDTRAGAHAGRGSNSSFEFAVGAAASAGVQLARERLDCQLVTESGPVTASGRVEDVLLDRLAVIQPSRAMSLGTGLGLLRSQQGALVIAVMGRLSAAAARELAGARHGDGPALALLLDVGSWAGEPPEAIPGAAPPAPGPATAPATILTAAGWRVVTVSAGQSLAAAWQRLHWSASQAAGPAPGGTPAGAPR